VTGIIVSGGVNVAAWAKAVKGVADLAKVIKAALKKEPKLREEMLNAVEVFTKEWNKTSGIEKGEGKIKSFRDAPKFITPAMAVAGLASSTKNLVEAIIELA
jgi:hypothetical protein